MWQLNYVHIWVNDCITRNGKKIKGIRNAWLNSNKGMVWFGLVQAKKIQTLNWTSGSGPDRFNSGSAQSEPELNL